MITNNISAQHTPGQILTRKQALVINRLITSGIGVDGFKLGFPMPVSQSHVYVDGAVTNKQLRIQVAIYSSTNVEDNFRETFASAADFIAAYGVANSDELTSDEINALPEAVGSPLGTAVMKLCRAVARAAIAKTTGSAS